MFGIYSPFPHRVAISNSFFRSQFAKNSDLTSTTECYKDLRLLKSALTVLSFLYTLSGAENGTQLEIARLANLVFF